MSCKTPCNDCPWRRNSAPGWLGSEMDAADWLSVAHSDDTVECHKRLNNEHCIGLAIYRRNVAKYAPKPNPQGIQADREAVFANPLEFHAHHAPGETLPWDWQLRRMQKNLGSPVSPHTTAV